jgi:hypothetical protein
MRRIIAMARAGSWLLRLGEPASGGPACRALDTPQHAAVLRRAVHGKSGCPERLKTLALLVTDLGGHRSPLSHLVKHRREYSPAEAPAAGAYRRSGSGVPACLEPTRSAQVDDDEHSLPSTAESLVDAIAEERDDPGEGGVSDPVRGDPHFPDPGQVVAEPSPERLVSRVAEGVAVAVPEKLVVLSQVVRTPPSSLPCCSTS